MAPLFVGPFFYWRPGTNADHRVSQRALALARGMQRWALFNVIVYFIPQSGSQTNTLICTHPVHCDACIAGHPGSTNDFRWIRSLLFSLSFFLSFLLPLFLSFFLSLFLLVLIFLYRPRVSSSSSFSPASSSSSRSISCSFHTRRGGGWDQIVYLPDKNRIESCHENRPLIMRIPRIAIIQHPIPSSRLFLFFFFFFFSSPPFPLSRKKLDREEILLLEVCRLIAAEIFVDGGGPSVRMRIRSFSLSRWLSVCSENSFVFGRFSSCSPIAGSGF